MSHYSYYKVPWSFVVGVRGVLGGEKGQASWCAPRQRTFDYSEDQAAVLPSVLPPASIYTEYRHGSPSDRHVFIRQLLWLGLATLVISSNSELVNILGRL